MPSKAKSVSNICSEKDNNLSFDPDENREIFKTYFGYLAQNLLNKLPATTNVFRVNSAHKYYDYLNLKNKFSFKTTTIVAEPSKATEIDDINGIFLKDGAIILATPIRDLLRLSLN